MPLRHFVHPAGIGTGAIGPHLLVVRQPDQVQHVIAFQSTFYYPTLPALIFLAAQSITYLARELPQEVQESFHRLVAALPRFYRALAVLFLLGTLLPLLPLFKDVADRIWTGSIPFLNMKVEDNYRYYSQGRWFALDQFSDLPDELVIATTEVGHVAALNPGKRAIDMAGLNDTTIAHDGFSAELLIDSYAPDLLYMPHHAYEHMIREIERCPGFNSRYEYFSLDQLDGNIQIHVALRRDSPFYGLMREIVTSHVR